MIRLLSAGFMRLRKNKFFWILVVFSIGVALFMICREYVNMKNYNDVVEAEQLMLNYSTFIGVVIAIFTSLFLGEEYSDGAIRNKISIGHKRIDIYLSNLVIITSTSLLLYVLFMFVISIVGIALFGGITMSIFNFLLLIGCIFLAIISYCSIFTFIAMLISNKTVMAIVSVMLAFGLMGGALVCISKLSETEFITHYIMVDDDIIQEEILNPQYPTFRERKIYQFLVNINPAGQMFQVAGRTVSDIKILFLYSLGIVVIFNCVGVIMFNRKDLR